MSNNDSEHSQHEIQPDRKYGDPMSKLAIESLPEETRKLSDEQAKAIAGGFMRRELSDSQLETIAFRNVARVIRVIGFEN
jgi:microsomal dipeptidase-like Zn-dependent dipeptidase